MLTLNLVYSAYKCVIHIHNIQQNMHMKMLNVLLKKKKLSIKGPNYGISDLFLSIFAVRYVLCFIF